VTLKYNTTVDLTETGNEGAVAGRYQYNESVDCINGEEDLSS